MAKHIRNLLQEGGLHCEPDPRKGLDHGAWIPVSIMFPESRPVVLQLSLHQSLDPALHFKLGESLRDLRREGVLIIGSGGITHNRTIFQQAYFSGDLREREFDWSVEFDTWITRCLLECSVQERKRRLLNFESHKLISMAHPETDHLLPLLVTLGAAGDSAGEKLWSGYQYGFSMSAFWFA